MVEHVGGILEDSERRGFLELLRAVAAGEQAHSQCPATRCGASMSQMLSPTTTAFSIGAPRRSAAARNRSGSGLAYFT